MDGWIKLHRQIVESDIYHMPPLYLRVFERLIIEANHQDKEIPFKYPGENVTTKKLIRRGERLTSIRQACEWVGWYEHGVFKKPNPRTIKNILDWLVANNMITIFPKTSNKEGTHYKIVNYDLYQDLDSEKVTISKQSVNNKTTVTTSKQECIRMNKNEKKNIYNIVFDHWNSKNIIVHKLLTDEFKKDIDKALKESTQEEILKAIDHYAEAYHDPAYEYCSYKWGIHELLTRKEGYKRFLDDGSKWLNYLRHKNSRKQDKQPTQSGNIFLEDDV